MQRETPWIRDLLDLKRRPRTGWFRVGVERPESVAEHSLGVGLLAWRLAKRRGLDADKALLLGVLHDFHEARLGDIPSPVKARFPEGALADVEREIIAEQWADDPEIPALLAELESGATPEARLVNEADALELLFQARRYRAAGCEEADEFLEDLENRESLKTLLAELEAHDARGGS